MTKLWTGAVPTMVRACAYNMGMFASYQETLERMDKRLPNNPNVAWAIACVTAGTMASVLSLPFDNAKTKMQKMAPGPDGKMPYRNIVHCLQLEM